VVGKDATTFPRKPEQNNKWRHRAKKIIRHLTRFRIYALLFSKLYRDRGMRSKDTRRTADALNWHNRQRISRLSLPQANRSSPWERLKPRSHGHVPTHTAARRLEQGSKGSQEREGPRGVGIGEGQTSVSAAVWLVGGKREATTEQQQNSSRCIILLFVVKIEIHFTLKLPNPWWKHAASRNGR